MKKTTPAVIESIRIDREQDGMTLYEIAKKHGLSKSTVFTIIRGMDSSKVKRSAPNRKVVVTVKSMDRPDLSKTDLGEASRQMICARLMIAGVKVFRPMTEDTPTDLLVLKGNGEVAKCQCKYIWPNGNGGHCLPLYSVRKNGPNSKAVKHKYTADEVDFFLGYCLDNDMVYVLPFEVCKGRSMLRLWIIRESMGTNGRGMFDAKLYAGAYDSLK